MVEISGITLLLFICFLICFYLVISDRKKPVSRSDAPPKMKRFTKNSSERSIMTLPKAMSSSYRPKKVIRICLTGGPSAGKTTALARLAFRLPEMGYRVISVPEAASLLSEGGANINMSQLDQTQQIQLQLRIIKLRMALEEIYTEIGERCGEKVVVICNAGVIDGSAYVTSDIWQTILDELGVTQVHLRDFRYDAIIHMVSPAQGAERYYSNKKTGQSIDEARIIDKMLQESYTGHPKFSIISNDPGKTFEDKLQKVTDVVFSILNIKAVKQYSYKLLAIVKDKDKDSLPIIPDYIKSQKILVEETFLESNIGEVLRVQKRGHSDSYNYLFTSEKIREDETTETTSQIISPRDYMNYLEKRDQTRTTVKRILQCFIQDDNYMILDTFLSIKFKGSILRVDTKKKLEEISFPDFIEVIRNVNDDPGYSTHKLAKINWYDSPDISKMTGY